MIYSCGITFFGCFLLYYSQFSTSLLGAYFFDTPAIFMYSLNTFLIAVFQNRIWDYACAQPDYLKAESANEADVFRFKLYCNLDMINGLLAIIISFFNPVVAFVFLFTKLPMILTVTIFHRKKMISLMLVSELRIQRK